MVVLALFLSTGQFNTLLEIKVGSSIDLGQLVLFGVYALTASILVVRWRKVVALAVQPVFLWLLLALAFLSTVWSYAPHVTLVRSGALVGATLFGLYLATSYEPLQILRLTATALSLAAVASIVLALFLPQYGLDSTYHDGAWQGIFVQKNALGRVMSIAVIALVHTVLAKRSRVSWGLLLGLSLLTLYFSDSATALLITLILLALLPAYRILRWPSTLTGVALMALGGLGVTLWVWLPSVVPNMLEALGRDATLTGRTVIWSGVWSLIQSHLWLGYGYGGFWMGWDGPSAHIWRLFTNWNPSDSHNGFLDIWSDVGVVGLTLFIFAFMGALWSVVRWIRADKSASTWPLSILGCLVLFNLTESAILRPTNLLWILFATIIFLSRRHVTSLS